MSIKEQIPRTILEMMVLDFANRQYPLSPLAMGAVWNAATNTFNHRVNFQATCNTRMREIWPALSEDVQNEIANLFGDDA